MKQIDKKQQLNDIINSKELGLIFRQLYVSSNYAQFIASDIKKDSTTIVRQLQKLEKVDLIKSKKVKKYYRTLFIYNWETLNQITANILNEPNFPAIFNYPFFKNLFYFYVKRTINFKLDYSINEILICFIKGFHSLNLMKVDIKSRTDICKCIEQVQKLTKNNKLLFPEMLIQHQTYDKEFDTFVIDEIIWKDINFKPLKTKVGEVTFSVN